MEQDPEYRAVALIVGATGMVGVTLAEALKNPTAPGGPWKVYGAASRPLPAWFPSGLLDHFITLDATNRDDTLQKLSPIASKITHIFWVALQIRETEQLNININSTMLTNVLAAINSASVSHLRHVTIQTGTKHYLGPIFDPSLSSQLVPLEPPFREDYPRLPYPNFYYALEDLVATYSHSFSYSIHRASLILGASSRSLYNTMLNLSVYATICRRKGLPCRYPGSLYTWEHFCDASDARVLAEQHIWAATTDGAKNEAYNCTNGDVFTWKSFWRVLCEVFEVEFVEFEEKDKFDILEFMKDKGRVWDEIVEEHGLYKTKMEEITCFEAVKPVLQLKFQHVSSMNRSREFGFFGYVDTLKSVRIWVERLRQMKLIP